MNTAPAKFKIESEIKTMSNNLLSLKLNLPTGEKDAEGKDICKDKTFVAVKPKGRMVRRAMEMMENTDEANFKTSDLDNMIQYVVDLFGNKFTIDDVYDGLDVDKIMPTITDCIKSVSDMFQSRVQGPNAVVGK